MQALNCSSLPACVGVAALLLHPQDLLLACRPPCLSPPTREQDLYQAMAGISAERSLFPTLPLAELKCQERRLLQRCTGNCSRWGTPLDFPPPPAPARGPPKGDGLCRSSNACLAHTHTRGQRDASKRLLWQPVSIAMPEETHWRLDQGGAEMQLDTSSAWPFSIVGRALDRDPGSDSCAAELWANSLLTLQKKPHHFGASKLQLLD